MNLKTTALTLGILSQLCSPLTWAADDAKVSRSLEEVTIAKEQTQLVMRQVTSNEQKERLRYVSDRLTSAEELLRQALNGGGGNNPRPPQYPSSVELYHSDSCSGNLIARVNAYTSCQSFSQAQATWGVKIDGQCLNIDDMPTVQACEAFKVGNSPASVSIHHSDSCSGQEIALISPETQCSGLETTGTAAWGIKVGGQCINITDTAPAKACEAFKSARSPQAVKIYHSDSCSGNLTAVVDYTTRCENLRGLPDAWGVEINGRCENISDIDIVQACERFKL